VQTNTVGAWILEEPPPISLDQGSGSIRGVAPGLTQSPRPMDVKALLPVISRSIVPPATSWVIVFAGGGSLRDLGPCIHYCERIK
jgi:hypothetical protein